MGEISFLRYVPRRINILLLLWPYKPPIVLSTTGTAFYLLRPGTSLSGLPQKTFSCSGRPVKCQKAVRHDDKGRVLKGGLNGPYLF